MERLELNPCAGIPCLGGAQGLCLKLRERSGGRQAGQRALSCQLAPYSRFPQDLPPLRGLISFALKQKLLSSKIPDPLSPRRCSARVIKY